jgi:hypothetical protein
MSRNQTGAIRPLFHMMAEEVSAEGESGRFQTPAQILFEPVDEELSNTMDGSAVSTSSKFPGRPATQDHQPQIDEPYQSILPELRCSAVNAGHASPMTHSTGIKTSDSDAICGDSYSSVQRTASIAPLLAQIERRIPHESRPDLAAAVHWKGGADFPIHRWFRYREGYSPRIVGQLRLGKDVLDPFCGCGSAMVGAALSERSSTGLDINPLAIFAAKVKLRPLTASQIRRVLDFQRLVEARPKISVPTWNTPSLAIARKLFEPHILRALSELRTAIDAQADLAVREFLLLAWLAILEEVGSYFKEGNGIKYRNKKRLKSGYVRRREGEWQLARFGPDQKAFAYHAFGRQLSMMVEDTVVWKQGGWSEQRVFAGNALDLPKLIEPGGFSSIVFSPPYANRFDYFESMKVELWFGGFVNSYQEGADLRKQALRSNLGADLKRGAVALPDLERLINHMDRTASSWRMRVPDALRGYFDDMFHVLKHCRQQLRGRGRCCVVVGNSAYAGVIIPTDSLIATLGLEAGFTSATVNVARHLTVSPQQRNALAVLQSHMRESVVVFQ